MREYAVYDTKDNDLIVKVGNVYELAEYFETSTNVIYCNISRKMLTKRRYEIIKVDDKENEND